MRPVICALLSIAASAPAAFAAAEVTLVLQFDAGASGRAISEMKTELQNRMRDSGVTLNWRRLDDLSASDAFPSVIVVTFHGSCAVKPFAPRSQDDSPVLAYSDVSDNGVIPFANVECDRVRNVLGQAAAGEQADRILGRALARVLAHELHHIISNTRVHAQHGIFQKSLTSQDLVADSF